MMRRIAGSTVTMNVLLVATVVISFLRSSGCHTTQWWAYVLPLVVFGGFYIYLTRSIRRST